MPLTKNMGATASTQNNESYELINNVNDFADEYINLICDYYTICDLPSNDFRMLGKSLKYVTPLYELYRKYCPNHVRLLHSDKRYSKISNRLYVALKNKADRKIDLLQTELVDEINDGDKYAKLKIELDGLNNRIEQTCKNSPNTDVLMQLYEAHISLQTKIKQQRGMEFYLNKIKNVKSFIMLLQNGYNSANLTHDMSNNTLDEVELLLKNDKSL